jgi:hypothetical protein
MIMASTNYEQEQRRIDLARARATRVPVFVRVAVTNPRANANAEFAEWVSRNAFLQKWPGAVNPKLHSKWRKVSTFARYFKGMARLVSDGPAVSVEISSPVTLSPDLEIPFGSRPVFAIQVVPA